MLAWLLPLFLKYALPYIVETLVSQGVMEAEKAVTIKSMDDLVAWAKTLKTHHSDADFPKQVHREGV